MAQNLDMAASEKEALVWLKDQVNDLLARLPKKVRKQEVKWAVARLQLVGARGYVRWEETADVRGSIEVIQKGLGIV